MPEQAFKAFAFTPQANLIAARAGNAADNFVPNDLFRISNVRLPAYPRFVDFCIGIDDPAVAPRDAEIEIAIFGFKFD